jgi:polysaccharide biosynthesis protein PslH
MKILFITPSYNYPPKKGYEIILRKQLEHLSLLHEVDVITFNKFSHNAHIDPLYKKVNFIKFIKINYILLLFNFISSFFNNIPFQVSLFSSKELKKIINSNKFKNKYDMMFFKLIRTAQFVPQDFNGLKIINMVDPLSISYKKAIKFKSFFLKYFFKIEARRLMEYELKITSLFDCVTFVSEKDVYDYKTLFPKANIQKLPYGIDVDLFMANKKLKRNGNMLIITGNMSYSPNINAALFFCDKVLPKILNKRPQTILKIVGVNPVQKIKNLNAHKNIEVTGFVKDMRAYLNEAKVSICAVKLDIGVQTKILEAMSMGTPVVTFPPGNFGIKGKEGKDICVVENSQTMANQILNLLNNKGWSAQSRNGRDFVIKNFSWEISMNVLDNLLKIKSVSK